MTDKEMKEANDLLAKIRSIQMDMIKNKIKNMFTKIKNINFKNLFLLCGTGITMVLYITVILFFVVSWPLNVYKFFTKCDFEAPFKAEFTYGSGLVSPTCYITAWLNIDDTKK